MSLIVLCNECGNPNLIRGTVPSKCAACDAPFSAQAEASLQRVLDRQRPAFLTAAAILGAIAGGFSLFFVGAILTGNMNCTTEGVPSDCDALTPILITWLLPIGVCSSLMAYAFWKEKAWGRPLAIAFFPVQALAHIIGGFFGSGPIEHPATYFLLKGIIPAIMMIVVFAGIREVAAYYAALEARTANEPSAAQSALVEQPHTVVGHPGDAS